MAKIDYNYIADLVDQIRERDSNAFAELYAATYQKQYSMAYKQLKDEHLAQDAFQEIYTTALKNIDSLEDPKLLLEWLNQINFRTCINLAEKLHEAEQHVIIEGKDYLLKQVMSLPFSESQALLLKYYNGLGLGEVAEMMDTNRANVKRYIQNGHERLQKILQQ